LTFFNRKKGGGKLGDATKGERGCQKAQNWNREEEGTTGYFILTKKLGPQGEMQGDGEGQESYRSLSATNIDLMEKRESSGHSQAGSKMGI